MAFPTRPGGAIRALDRSRFPGQIEFHYFQRHSRARLVTEAMLLTPPLLVADIFCNVGRALAEAEWDIDLIGLLLDVDDSDRSGGRHSGRGSGGSRRRTSSHSPSPSKNQATGPPKLNPRRVP
jgi:hypothetical protein